MPINGIIGILRTILAHLSISFNETKLMVEKPQKKHENVPKWRPNSELSLGNFINFEIQFYVDPENFMEKHWKTLGHVF